MAIIRRFTSYPPIEVLNEIEAVNIVDQAGPAKIAGLAMGTVAVVGEFLKGPVNTPTLITSPKQLQDMFGTWSRYSNPGGSFPQQTVDDGDAPLPYSTSDMDGNAFIAMYRAKFGALVVVNIDQSVGTIGLSRSASTTRVVVPAGSRVKLVTSGGNANWFALLDDVEFDKGTTSVTGIRIRRIAGSDTNFDSGSGELFDKPDSDTWTVTLPSSITDLDQTAIEGKYKDALDSLKADNVPANLVTIVVATRHTENIMGYLHDHAIEVSSSGRGRIAVVAPPVGTRLSTVTGNSGVGVGNTSIGRSDRVVYVWPAGIKYVQEIGEAITVPADVDAAGLISQTPPEENPAQPTNLLSYIIGIEESVANTLTVDTYKTLRASGVMALRYDKATGMGFQSGVTSVDPSAYPELRNIARRRMADFIEDSLANRWQIYNKKIMSNQNRNAITAETVAFLEGLKSADRIADYSVDDESGNTPDNMAQGIFVINVNVRTYASMDAIVLNGHIGETVEIMEG